MDITDTRYHTPNIRPAARRDCHGILLFSGSLNASEREWRKQRNPRTGKQKAPFMVHPVLVRWCAMSGRNNRPAAPRFEFSLQHIKEPAI